jgi:hypothetical protein
MPNAASRKHHDWFNICSWVFLILVFIGLIIYMSLHVEDLLDSDMASDLILAHQLKESGGILSGNWYYSTEIKFLNTQLVYSLLFYVFDDWQTVRILGNVALYLILLGSYYFLCRKLRISRYFPFTAGILLLPLSGWYFYILLYGVHYLLRVSMMFVILGILMQPPAISCSKTSVILNTLVACLFSFALGLEGPRMMLVLFVPVTIVVGAEFFRRAFSHDQENSVKRSSLLRQDGFPKYLTQAFLVCVFALTGFLINKMVLSHAYPFRQYDLILELSYHRFTVMLSNQVDLIGYGILTQIFSIAVWATVGTLIAWFFLHKGEKSTSALRFLWTCFVSWVCYAAFYSLIRFGYTANHMVPVAILFIPAVAVIIREFKIKPVLRRVICIGLSLCMILTGLQGYSRFESWPFRSGLYTNETFKQIEAELKEQGYRNGYATFWNANVLTELSDGEIEVWCVKQFDEQTPNQPQIFRWLQDKAHDTTRPTGKVFLVWTAKEYSTYDPENLDYLGEVLYRNDAFIVYDVIQ